MTSRRRKKESPAVDTTDAIIATPDQELAADTNTNTDTKNTNTKNTNTNTKNTNADTNTKNTNTDTNTKKTDAKKPKYEIGDIVYISKEADADLNGFKLFPQYKKYNYTVEAYEADTGVYVLRKLNLSLRLPEGLLVAPSERAHDTINRRQF